MPKTERAGAKVESNRRLGSPSSLDWRSSNIITSVKNQGNCGSCWAFASIAAAEAYLVKEGKFNKDNIDLSEQYLISCTPGCDCGGGYL